MEQLTHFTEQLHDFVTRHWTLWLAFLVILGLIYLNEWSTQRQRAKELSTADALEHINHHDAIVIDLRDKETFKKGHIIDAIHAGGADFLEQRMDKYKTKSLIFVCERGLQAATLATKLRKQGFQHAMVLKGGLTAWREANLPLVKK